MKTVIFDLGRVLVQYDWKSYLETFRFNEETFQQVADAIFLSEQWPMADAGQYDSETWLPAFICNAPHLETEIRSVYAHLERTVTPFSHTPEVIAHFRRLGYRIYYLSNYSKPLYEMTKDCLSFISDFDGGVFSYEEKCIKPQETIYKILLKRYDIKSEDALFFDDREENILTANALGIRGILFDESVIPRILRGDYD